MAFYSSSYDDANFGEYYQTPYDVIHDFFPSEPYNDYNSFNYDSSPCYGANYDPGVGDQSVVSHDFFTSESLADNSSYAYESYSCFDYNSGYDPNVGQSVVSYSSYNFSEPKYVEYGLDPYGGDYSTVKTRFIVSYSVSDQFNEPAFDEYDPTPYGGGYNPDAEYGKPLPPSEEICFPRSEVDPNDQSLNNISYGSIKSPYGKEEGDEPVKKPSNGGGKTEQKPQSVGGDDDNGGSKEMTVEDSNENGAIGDDGSTTEYEKRKVTQIPPGYGLEAMDLCESLFGYWPCLARGKRDNDCKNCHGICHKHSNESCYCQWQGSTTADYLFGNCYPYGERWGKGGVYENPMFNYQRHHQQQHLTMQMEYHEEYSWLN